MCKQFLLLVFAVLMCTSSLANAGPEDVYLSNSGGNWKRLFTLRSHNNDCTALADGYNGEGCYEFDDDDIYICEPTAGDCDTPSEWRCTTCASGSGEANTASNLGGGLANFDTKSGVDLRFNSFLAADFDLATNVISIDASIARDSEVAAAYQPLDSDLTSIAALSTTAFGRGLLDDADAAAARTTIGVVIGTNVQAWDADLDDLADGTLSGSKVQVFGSGNAGAVPASGGGTTNFLRADGTWAAPPGGGGGSPGGQTTEVQFNSSGSFEGADKLTFASSTAGAAFGAGSTSAGSWPTIASGSLLTTAEDNAIENDGDVFYYTTDAGNRGYVPARHCIRADASRSLPNDVNENAIFNSPTNGRLTLETGTYLFQGMVYVTGMSATSGNALIDVLGAGTATAGTWLWHAVGIDNTTPTNAGTQTGSFTITQQSAASIVTAGTGTAMAAQIRGTVEITGAGTLIPSIDQVTASAATLAAGSYFCIERIGSTSLVSIGQWD